MEWLAAIICIVAVGFAVFNGLVRHTNGYKNFYRAIHVVKDVPPDQKYDIAAFGSTFSYYAFDLKEYDGHNFSVEPQSIFYISRTVKHFIDNIEESGYAVFALTGCIFASGNNGQEANCPTYYSFMKANEIDDYRKSVKWKCLINRYFPILNPHFAKSLIHDSKLVYSISSGVSEANARVQAQTRLKGWAHVLGVNNVNDFRISKALVETMDATTEALRDTISYVRSKGIKPVILVLPMSRVFNKECPKALYEKVLYPCLNKLTEGNIEILDFLFDEELSDLELYWNSDCLNARGRKLLTQRMMERINASDGDIK